MQHRVQAATGLNPPPFYCTPCPSPFGCGIGIGATKKPKTFANLLFLMSDHFSYRRAGDDKQTESPKIPRSKTTKAYRRRQAQIQLRRGGARGRQRDNDVATIGQRPRKTSSQNELTVAGRGQRGTGGARHSEKRRRTSSVCVCLCVCVSASRSCRMRSPSSSSSSWHCLASLERHSNLNSKSSERTPAPNKFELPK